MCVHTYLQMYKNIDFFEIQLYGDLGDQKIFKPLFGKPIT